MVNFFEIPVMSGQSMRQHQGRHHGYWKDNHKTGTVVFDEISCGTYIDCTPGDYVLLSVGNNGCGMDRETLEHVFEPFFTAKRIGRGTGLRLVAVYGIVKQNKRLIQLYSEPGRRSDAVGNGRDDTAASGVQRLVAATHSEAIGLIEENSAIQLFITDVVMPEL